MPYRQGDVVIVPFPFSDLAGNKVRPAVVVSNSSVNRSSDVILVQLTTQEVTGPLTVEISNSDVSTPFKPPHDRMKAYCKKIAVVEKALIRNKITELSPEKLNEVFAGIIHALRVER